MTQVYHEKRNCQLGFSNKNAKLADRFFAPLREANEFFPMMSNGIMLRVYHET